MRTLPTILSAASLLVLSGCTMPRVLSSLNRESPPPAHGRPGWVRASAQVGGTGGALVGGIASLIFLPVTWPVSQMFDEPLGYSRVEFVFFPVSLGAGAGHFLLGAPADLFDYTFRRAWVGTPPPTDYDFVPQRPPQHGALAAEAAGTPPEARDVEGGDPTLEAGETSSAPGSADPDGDSRVPDSAGSESGSPDSGDPRPRQRDG